MADEVEIVNVGGESGVASEATLKQLLAAMNKMAGGGAGGAATEAKARKLANEAISKGTTLQDDNSKSVKNNTEQVDKAATAAKDFAYNAGRLAAQGLKQALQSTVDFSKELLVGGTGLADFTQHIPVIGSLITPLASIIDSTVDSFRTLSASGASFNNSITEMRRASAQSGLTLEEFGGLITQNSQNLMYLGGTVTQGAQRFVQMNRGLKDLGEFENLKAMGFSVMEINEGMAEYIGLQARMGTLQGKSTKELAEGSATYLKQIDMLAKVTGMTRKEAEAALQAQAADAGARAMLNALGEGTQEFRNLQQSMAIIDRVGGAAGTAMKDLLDGVANTEEGQKMIAAAGPEVAEALRQVGRGADPQVLLDAMKAAGGDIEKFAGLEGQERAAFIANLRDTDPVLAGLLDGATQMIAQGGADLEAARNEQNARDEITKKLATFDDSVRKIRESIQTMLIDSGIFELVANGLGVFADLMSGVSNAISNFTTAIAEGDIWGAITSLFTGTAAVGAIAAGITALFLGKAAIGAVTSGIGGIMGRMSSGLTDRIGRMFGGGGGPMSQAAPRSGGARGGGGGLAKSAGNAGKGIGAFFGNLAGGVMKGVASGLAAFANPAILIGAGILAGAITIIGAGIAGATWILGKALPTFAEGLESFATIDGNNLVNVAKGIAAVGAAMAAMGAGAAVGAVGNVIANVLDMIPGKSPLEKLVEFSKVNMDAAKVEANARAAVAFAKAMAAMGAGGAAGSLGGAVSSVVDGLVGFFGGSTEPPWDKVKAFGDLQLNTQGIVRNAGAVAAYAVAISDFPETPAPSLLSSFKTGIASLFGAEKDPFAPIKAFGELQLNTQQIISNAGALAAYAVAISGFPETPAPSLLSSFKTGVAALFGAETDPFAPIKAFGELALNTQGIIANAGAVAAYAMAIKDFPESPAPSLLSSLRTGVASLLGGETDPFAPMKRFGDLQLNTQGINNNALAVSAFASAMANMPQIDTTRSGGVLGALTSWFAGDEQMPWDAVRAFGDANINVEGVTNNAQAINAMSTALTGFSAETLDTAGVISYTNAIENLVEQLQALNAELKKDNDSFLGGDKASAGELLNNISLSSSTGTQNLDSLRQIMEQMLEVMSEERDLSEKIEKNTKGMSTDLLVGDVSRF